MKTYIILIVGCLYFLWQVFRIDFSTLIANHEWARMSLPILVILGLIFIIALCVQEICKRTGFLQKK